MKQNERRRAPAIRCPISLGRFSGVLILRDSKAVGWPSESGADCTTPAQAEAILRAAVPDPEVECFVMLSLNRAGRAITARLVTTGTQGATLISPQTLFRHALQDGAAAVIVAHNHPSGSVNPSPEDCAATQRLADAGRLIGIQLLDHLILGAIGKCYSFNESGPSFKRDRGGDVPEP